MKLKIIFSVVLFVLLHFFSYAELEKVIVDDDFSFPLTDTSIQIVKTLSKPVNIKVFFSENLPSEYSKVSTYVKDLLTEYKGAANKNFNYTVYDLEKPENQKVALSYGLHQIQIQEVKNDEVCSKKVWMGVVVTYGDSFEVIDAITSEIGLEYSITRKLSKLISTADILDSLSDRISLSYYVTDKLAYFEINGYLEADKIIQQAFEKINKRYLNHLTYQKTNTSDEVEIRYLVEKYGIQHLVLKDEDNINSSAVFGLVVEYGDKFRIIPLSIQHSVSGFGLSGLDTIEEGISDSIQSLLSKATQIGYITGNGEKALTDENGEQVKFQKLLSDMYELTELNLEEDDIPANLTAIIINGPEETLSDAELYKIDQFVMRGGNVMIFADPFTMNLDNYYQPATFTPLDNGLNTLLEKYGVKLESNYVFDENCYVARQQGYGNISLYWAPQLSGKSLNQKHPVTKNLGYVIFLQAGGINTTAAEENKDVKLTVLANTSKKGWKEGRNIQLTPNMEAPYDKSTENSYPLAVLLEGKFNSAFEGNPADLNEEKADDAISTSTHIAKAKQSGKVFVTGTSYITSNQLIDDNGKEPISIFVRNLVDYMNGNIDFCLMRTNTLSIFNIKELVTE